MPLHARTPDGPCRMAARNYLHLLHMFLRSLPSDVGHIHLTLITIGHPSHTKTNDHIATALRRQSIREVLAERKGLETLAFTIRSKGSNPLVWSADEEAAIFQGYDFMPIAKGTPP